MADEPEGSAKGKRKGKGKEQNDIPIPVDADGKISILVEMASSPGATPSHAATQVHELEDPGFEIDEEFEVVPVNGANSGGQGMGGSADGFVVRGVIDDPEQLAQVRSQPGVAGAWLDTPIAPLDLTDETFYQAVADEDGSLASACPIPPCDCTPGTPKGTMASVATFIGVNQLWGKGLKGAGIVVGVVDGGITAQGRPVKQGETSRRISRVIGGWPSDWGTEAGKWDQHGNMCATDVLGMAPDAQLYDFRISGAGGSPGTISRALQAFQWSINRHKQNGTPHILTNSWGIFQEAWDPQYARNPNHPFTRKVVEAINEGIIVLFAAGNCGATCPDGRCRGDNGPGRDIWGANGHPKVMTVGAVNPLGQFIGYSSQGPAALDPNKPDFCGIAHFTGYFRSDSGTSAATPITAGVVALLKQAKKQATQDQIKNALKSTAKNIGPPGFDRNSGAGIIQAKAAHDKLVTPVDPCARYLPLLRRVLALARRNPRLQACLCHYVCRRGPRPRCTRQDIAIVRRVLAILRRCPKYRAGFCRALRCPDPCRQYVPFLRRVLAAARRNPRLRACLCHYVCRRGPRPRCTRQDIAIVRRVLAILRRCPRYRVPFCRGLACPPRPGAGAAAAGADIDEDYATLQEELDAALGASGDGEDEAAGLDEDLEGFEAGEGGDEFDELEGMEAEDAAADVGIDELDFDDDDAFGGEDEDMGFEEEESGVAMEEDEFGFDMEEDEFEFEEEEEEFGFEAELEEELEFGFGEEEEFGFEAELEEELEFGFGEEEEFGFEAELEEEFEFEFEFDEEEDEFGMGAGEGFAAAPEPACPPALVGALKQIIARARRDRRLRACLCAAFCRRRRLPTFCRRYLPYLRRVAFILRRCPQLRRYLCRALRCGVHPPPCKRYVPFLRRVIAAARRDPRLRACLCHFICRQGPRPRPPTCRKYANLLRRVAWILRRCPQFRRPFCAALRCRPVAKG